MIVPKRSCMPHEGDLLLFLKAINMARFVFGDLYEAVDLMEGGPEEEDQGGGRALIALGLMSLCSLTWGSDSLGLSIR